MKNYLKTIDTIITISLTLAIVSSFFIIKNLHIGIIKIPQLFYLFLAISLIATIIKIKFSTESREILTNIIKKYGILIGIFFFFILLNFVFYPFHLVNNPLPLFWVDLLRVISEVILAVIIIVHLGINKQAHKWLTIAFFAPLVLIPLLLFRDMDKIMNILPGDFFSGHALQALQGNTTSLATWLIITFAFSVSFLFKKIQEKKPFPIMVFSLITITMTSLIWWTNSRGALLAAIIIYATVGYLYYIKQKTKIILVLSSMVLLFFISLYILPTQAKINVFVRYYPQYLQKAISSNFIIPSIKDLAVNKNKTLILPDFTNAQNRQNFWPKHILYIINHPIGIYGPEIFYTPELSNLQEGEHNTLLQVGKWGGWGALIMFGLFIIYIFKISLNLVKKYHDIPYTLGITTAFLGIFILMMLNSFIQLKTFWIISAMIIAYSIYKNILFS